VIVGEAEALVEAHCGCVAIAHLEVELRATSFDEELDSPRHQARRDALAAEVRVAGQVVDPSAMAVVAHHE